MNIILSRKGFDSKYGGVPSPIFPSGELYSLPIPEKHQNAHHTYGELQCNDANIGDLVVDLGGQADGKALTRASKLHLDPDLRRDAVPRAKAWQPCFGQCNAAQTHLEKQNVQDGDVFLYFGSFRRVERVDGKWSYIKRTPTIHLIFGWLQIGAAYRVNRDIVPSWLKYHDHFLGKYPDNNTIYVSAPPLTINSKQTAFPAAGVFSHFHMDLQLTDSDEVTNPRWNRSKWRLPSWFHPSKIKGALSRHSNMDRWKQRSDCVLLDTVSIGQEFVLDCAYYPEAKPWLLAKLRLDNYRVRG